MESQLVSLSDIVIGFDTGTSPGQLSDTSGADRIYDGSCVTYSIAGTIDIAGHGMTIGRASHGVFG
jgi:hypothetical protein